MDPLSKSKVIRGAAGASLKEDTRDELLLKVRNERTVRQEAKARIKACVVIQKFYRGLRVRKQLAADMQRVWLTKYQQLAAKPDANLSAEEVSAHVLPPILMVYTCRPAWSASVVLVRHSDTTALRGAVALLLRSVTAPDDHHNYLALAASEATRVSFFHQCHRLLRIICELLGNKNYVGDGLLQSAAARFLSIITHAAPLKHNTTSATPTAADQERRGATCFQLLSFVTHHALAAAAVTRLVDAIQQHNQKLETGSTAEASSSVSADAFHSQLCGALQQTVRVCVAYWTRYADAAAQQELIDQLTQVEIHPVKPHPHALKRDITQLFERTSIVEHLTTTTTTTTAGVPREGPGSTCLHADDSCGSHEMVGERHHKKKSDLGGASSAAEKMSHALLTTPNLCSILPLQAVQHLTSLSVFATCLQATYQMACCAVRDLSDQGSKSSRQHGRLQLDGESSSVRDVGVGHQGAPSAAAGGDGGGPNKWNAAVPVPSPAGVASSSTTTPWQYFDLTEALWAFSNLVNLASRARLSSSTSTNGKQLQLLHPSTLLTHPTVVSLYVDTLNQLLSLMELQLGTRHITSATLTEQHLHGALREVWPLCEGVHATQLMDALEKYHPKGIFLLTTLYCRLILVAPQLYNAAAGVEWQDGAILRFINAVAFGCTLLPKLWRLLANTIGLPLEAPPQATRGWDIAALQGGGDSLGIEDAMQLGLFCRVYAHYLLVVDDTDFYEEQKLFSLHQQRAIATVLNTLVFRSHCPATPTTRDISKGAYGDSSPLGQHHITHSDSTINAPSGASDKGPILLEGGAHQRGSLGHQLLRKWAPLLLRAIYDRDVRRSFCPPSLWLAPYQAAATQQQQQSFLADAVVRSLLSRGDADDTSQHLIGWRPSSLASLLVEAPHAVPFELRLEVFRILVAADKQRGKWGAPPVEGGPAPIPITVRRGRVLEDGLRQLGHVGNRIKGRVVVNFVNQQGLQEAGMDYGGLLKEFLEEVIKQGFNAQYALFTSTEEGFAYPQPIAGSIVGGLDVLHFLGLIVGKAMYEGILLDIPLAPFFVAKLQGRQPLFDELCDLDAELHRHLSFLKRYEGEVEALGLTFTVDEEALGKRANIELLPGGSELAVTSANRLHYCYLLANYHLDTRLSTTATAFASGVAQVIPSSWLRLFNPKEINELLGGGDTQGIDVDDLMKYTQYSGGYGAHSAAIRNFWKVLRSFSAKDRQALLKFVTSCGRPPLGGFKHLTPPFVIHKVHAPASVLVHFGAADVDRLPSASTCYNMLKLPNYRKMSTLREKLLYAIHSGSGFELS